jgi:sugar O-acyltransferase (sialic acid O-acetyltransferase NeuD family)
MRVIGSGGHAKVIVASLLNSGFKVENIFDEDLSKNGQELLNIKILAPISNLINASYVIGIGDNKSREKICLRYKQINWGTVIDTNSTISKEVIISEGTVILTGSIVQIGTKIGRHCVLNTKSSVDHDCIIHDFVHISPGATLCGNVEVNIGTHIGAGAIILPNIKIGKWCKIGAGAVIINNVADYAVVVGNPGRIIKNNIFEK